jgi:hypothetical protein
MGSSASRGQSGNTHISGAKTIRLVLKTFRLRLFLLVLGFGKRASWRRIAP